jgi:hypothetical protein
MCLAFFTPCPSWIVHRAGSRRGPFIAVFNLPVFCVSWMILIHLLVPNAGLVLG